MAGRCTAAVGVCDSVDSGMCRAQSVGGSGQAAGESAAGCGRSWASGASGADHIDARKGVVM